jgi:Lactate racemase N-terminal domain
VTRVPLLSGTRIAVVEVPDGGTVLRPPPPVDVLGSVRSATSEALRFPLAGPPLAGLVKRGGTATVVIELPNLPLPSATPDPRQEAIAATVDELERLGVEHVTILVACGLFRRPSPREIGLLVTPEFRRRFRGRLIVHDAEGEDLVELGAVAGVALRVSPALVETDLVVTVTAAETVLHGGPSALVRACSTEALRASGAASLLEPSSSQGWRLALELERLLATHAPLYGVSLVLNLPNVFGGYPYEEQILERIARSKLRRGLALLPAAAGGEVGGPNGCRAS